MKRFFVGLVLLHALSWGEQAVYAQVLDMVNSKYTFGPIKGFTAVLSLLRLDISAAFRANLMALPELAFILWAALSYTLVYIRTGKKQLAPKPDRLNWVFLILLVIWTVVRNIMGI